MEARFTAMEGGRSMRDLSQGKFRQQITFLRRQFLQEGDLPFRDVLSEELVQDRVSELNPWWW